MQKQFYVYIMSNAYGNVLYTGVTSNLQKRVFEHKEKAVPGFTNRYKINRLVYYEAFDNAYNAISREKQIKAGTRRKKIALIGSLNPGWEDLFDKL